MCFCFHNKELLSLIVLCTNHFRKQVSLKRRTLLLGQLDVINLNISLYLRVVVICHYRTC